MKQLQTRKFRKHLLYMQVELVKAAATELETNKEIKNKTCYEADLLKMVSDVAQTIDEFDETMKDYVIHY